MRNFIHARLRTLPVVVWMVLLALLLRLAVVPFDSILVDAERNHVWEQGNVARALLAGHGFASPFASAQTSAIMPPVYPIIVAGFFSVFGTHSMQSLYAIQAFNCLLSALACIPVFLITRRSFGRRVALWASWAWVFSPYGIYFSATKAWSTHLLLLCLCWLLYLAQDMERSPRMELWAGFGLLAGFAGLTEPSILVVIPFLLVLAVWRLAQAGQRWLLPGAVASLMLAATLSPWLIRNALVFHRVIPMRDSMGLELWLGNNGSNLRWTSDDKNPLSNAAELAAYNAEGELAFMDRKALSAKEYIQRHPSWYAWMCARRAGYLWTGYWSFDPNYLVQEPMDLANIPFESCLTLFALVGLYLTAKRRPFEVLRYGGVLFLFPLMYCFTHPQPYHMRPLDPLIAVLGCYATLCLCGAEEDDEVSRRSSAPSVILWPLLPEAVQSLETQPGGRRRETPA